MSRPYLLLLGAAVAAVGGCTLAPTYQRPEAPVPATWPVGPAYRQAPATTMPAADIPWREFFVDRRLQAIIRIALDNNRDLRLAALNAERAQALYGIQRAELYPAVSVAGTASLQRVPADLSFSGKRTTLEQYSVDLGIVSWEVDLFGRVRSLEQSALEEFLATVEGRRAAQIVLVSEVAGTVLALAADRENLNLAETTLVGQEAALDLVERRFARGWSPELDVHRARVQVETARVALARYTQRVAEDENALSLLLGAPVPADLLPSNLAGVAPLLEISAGLSSEVLLGRPDVLQAERRLMAAYADIGAARAAFFPRISLTAALGTASSELSGLFKGGSGTWTFVPQVLLPIFDARTWAAVRVTEADRRIALAQYERAIQTSFREVADTLAVRGTVDRQVAAQESLVEAAAETYRLSTVRYEVGIDSYLGVLDAQRFLFAAEQDLVSLRLAKMASQVRLYAVLGGGWQPETPAEGS